MKKNVQLYFTCPLCKSNETASLFQSYNRHGRHDIDLKDSFTVRRCQSCDVVFLPNIKIDNAYYKKYYDTGYYDGGNSQSDSIVNKIITKLETWSLRQKEKTLLKSVKKHPRKLKILDIGCGSGKFLDSLNSKKFKKSGIEINKEGIQLSRKKGIEVYEKDVTKINFGKKKFDIVTLWHVQEHLEHPIAVFKKIYDILEKDGILLSATPNTDSLGFKIGKAQWFHLDSPRHLILFNKKSNRYICNQTGFRVVSNIHEPYDFPLDLFWSLKNSHFKYIVYPLYPLVKFFDHEALIQIFRK